MGAPAATESPPPGRGQRLGRGGRVALGGVAAWLVFAYLLAPPLIAALYRGDVSVGHAELTAALAEARAEASLAEHLAEWRWFAVWPAVAVLAGWLFARLTGNRRLVERHVLGASASSLAGIRILVAAVAGAMVLWEDFPSSALLPRAMADSTGVMDLLRAVPGFDALLASVTALAVLEALTLAALAAVLVGWRTRWVLPAAALGYLVLGGTLRLYSRFFHAGLVPFYLLAVLCFTPCADALSLDRRRRAADGAPPAREAAASAYGWARFACWTVMALVYFEAGLSKLRSGGLAWWHPDNLRAIVMTDSLNPMAFDFGLGLSLASAPAALFAVFGIGALATELAYPAVLVWRPARRLLPLAAAAVHVGILLLQNVAFLDLVVLQAMFYRWSLPGRGPRRPTGASEGVLGSAPGEAEVGERGARRVRRLAFLFLFVWALRLEVYPLSSMQMYASRNESGEIRYLRVLAHRASGAVTPAPLEEAIPALADARYRWTLRGLFAEDGTAASGRRAAVARSYLHAAAAAYNRDVPTADRILAFEVHQHAWDVAPPPPRRPEATPGVRIGEVVVPVPKAGAAP
ncbi:MAG TPA: hypothetical protein VHQ65_10735 [Thermoanaerobaculia bacterium]|nr:hypothetical protein [Thermoanaerobaculia bacterium]